MLHYGSEAGKAKIKGTLNQSWDPDQDAILKAIERSETRNSDPSSPSSVSRHFSNHDQP